MKSVHAVALIVSFGFSHIVKAQEITSTPISAPAVATYKIKQVIPDRNIVVVESSNVNEVLKPEKVFLVTFPNDKQCSLYFKEKTGALLTFSTSACSNAQDITKSLPIEPALVDIPVVAPPASPAQPVAEKGRNDEERPWQHKFALGVYFSSANEMKFSDVYVTTASTSGKLEATYNGQSAAGIHLSFAKLEPFSWGYMGSFLYENKRELTSATLRGSGGTSNIVITEDPPSVSFLIAEYSALYRWQSFYLPFGFNYSFPDINDLGSDGTYSGGVGYFVGGGFLIGDRSSVEFFIRSVILDLKIYSGTSTIDYGRGSLSGFGLGYKHWF